MSPLHARASHVRPDAVRWIFARNPDDAPEATRDYTGFDFWQKKLNQFNGDFIAAEMVKAFITSIEYRQRFTP